MWEWNTCTFQSRMDQTSPRTRVWSTSGSNGGQVWTALSSCSAPLALRKPPFLWRS